jgi:hypothetical protein
MNQIILQKQTLRRLNATLLHRQVSEIMESGLQFGGRRGWFLSRPIDSLIQPKINPEGGWIYQIEISLERDPPSDKEEAEFTKIKDTIAKVAPTKGSWFIPGYTPKGNTLTTLNGIDVIAEINIDKGLHFANLFGLDPQIDVLLAALQIAKDTNYTKRYHTVLYGSPGGGKSEILRGVKDMAGENGVIELDGTQSTAAGAINLLMNTDILPPILIIEEIEKVSDASFMWLLGVLDGRAEIRKVTNWGVSQRKLPCVCIATVNDLDLFQSRHSGALASRFAHKLYCPRPTEEILRRILLREVLSINGNLEWVEPAIRYCVDIEKTTDPRRFVACCLTGRDQLLTGQFQANLIACRNKE